MRSVFIRLKESFCKEPLLWLAIFLCFGFSMIGAHWGRVEDWNPDQMAFRPVPNNLMVGDYLKPPLNTYVHRLMILNSVEIVMNEFLHTETKLSLQTGVLGLVTYTRYGTKDILLVLWMMESFTVPLGFIVGCPGAVFDRTRFVQDFLYNLYTTPVYCGDVSRA